MPFVRYRDVLRRPAIGWLLGASIVGRLPAGMSSLAVILVVRERGGGYAGAGGLIAAYAVGAALSAPPIGRAVDRLGRRVVMVPLAVVFAGMLAGLAAVAGRALAPAIVLAFLAGATAPPVAAAARSLWPVLLQGPERQALYAIEATLQELVFVLGPAIVAGIVAVSSPVVALVASGVGSLVGVLAFVAHPSTAARAVTSGPPRAAGSLLRHGLLLRVFAAVTLLAVALHMCDVSVVASAGGSRAGTAGLLLTLWSLGSMMGGLFLGGRLQRRWLGFAVGAVAVHFGSLALAPGTVVLAVLLVIGGTTVAPTLALLYDWIGGEAPAVAATEAFAWMTTAILAGGAVGASLGGVLADTVGPRWGFAVAGMVTVAAAGVATRAVRRLPPVVAPAAPAPTASPLRA